MPQHDLRGRQCRIRRECEPDPTFCSGTSDPENRSAAKRLGQAVRTFAATGQAAAEAGQAAAEAGQAAAAEADQAALPPFLLHSDRNFLRSLPCRPLAVAWSEHSFETAFLSVSVGFAAAADGAAAGFMVGAGCCAKAALAPIRTTHADSIKLFENLIATSPVDPPHPAPDAGAT
jgi:hypothetical protein